MKSFKDYLTEVNEAVTSNEKDKIIIKSGSSVMYVQKSSNGISIGIKEGQDHVMIDLKSSDIKAIKNFLQ